MLLLLLHGTVYTCIYFFFVLSFCVFLFFSELVQRLRCRSGWKVLKYLTMIHSESGAMHWMWWLSGLDWRNALLAACTLHGMALD